MKFRKDVEYTLPPEAGLRHLSVGIVTGKPSQFPTIFVEAFTATKADEAFFRRVVKQLTQ